MVVSAVCIDGQLSVTAFSVAQKDSFSKEQFSKFFPIDFHLMVLVPTDINGVAACGWVHGG